LSLQKGFAGYGKPFGSDLPILARVLPSLSETPLPVLAYPAAIRPNLVGYRVNGPARGLSLNHSLSI
jgi:hypothetical protein